jgi:RNA polymerase sigma-70 factor (ECF subfamily)
MSAITDIPRHGLDGDPDAVISQLYSLYAKALRRYVEQFCPDPASAEDIVQETFIRAWRHLPQLSADDRPVRPWLYRVARNLMTDANRAARTRPITVPGQSAGETGTDSGVEEILDRQLVSAALQHLSPPQAAASGFGGPYAIPDTATTALGILLAVTILATAGRMGRQLTAPESPRPRR